MYIKSTGKYFFDSIRTRNRRLADSCIATVPARWRRWTSQAPRWASVAAASASTPRFLLSIHIWFPNLCHKDKKESRPEVYFVRPTPQPVLGAAWASLLLPPPAGHRRTRILQAGLNLQITHSHKIFNKVFRQQMFLFGVSAITQQSDFVWDTSQCS